MTPPMSSKPHVTMKFPPNHGPVEGQVRPFGRYGSPPGSIANYHAAWTWVKQRQASWTQWYRSYAT